jgi:hypothetical protein
MSTSNTPPEDIIKPFPHRDTPQANPSSQCSTDNSSRITTILSLEPKAGQSETIFTKFAISTTQRSSSLLTKALEECRRTGTLEFISQPVEFEFIQKEDVSNGIGRTNWTTLSECGSSPPKTLLSQSIKKDRVGQSNKSSSDRPQSVVIKCARSDNTFRVLRRASFANMMTFFSQQMTIPLHEAVFLWRGHPLNKDDTPEKLGMDNLETIHIRLRNTPQGQKNT